ncbi:MAG: DUF1588 domain-containing protein [Bdellovibrionales bacterium]
MLTLSGCNGFRNSQNENLSSKGLGDSSSALTEQGTKLYSAHCSVCHGALDISSVRGKSLELIQSNISNNPAMSALKKLSESEVKLIALALNPTNQPSTVDNPTPSTVQDGIPGAGSGPRFACLNSSARGGANRPFVRMSREAIVASLSTVFGDSILGLNSLKNRIAGIPEDRQVDGSILPTATYEHALAYVNLYNDLSDEILKNQNYMRKYLGDCSVEQPDESCLRGFVDKMSFKLHRKFLTADRLNDIVNRVSTGENAGLSSGERFKLALMRLLIGPDFQFAIAEGERNNDQTVIGSTQMTRVGNGAEQKGNSQLEILNGNEWLIYRDNSNFASSDPALTRTFEKIVVVASATPGSGGVYPSFRLDWNFVPHVDRPDMTRVNGAHQIFVFDGSFGYMTDSTDQTRAELYNKFQIGLSMRGPSAAQGGKVTIHSVILVDLDGPRIEVVGERMKLSQLEVADQIALRVSGGIPDDSLLIAALNGELTSSARVRSEAQRLLESPLGRSGTKNFFRDYARLKNTGEPVGVSSQQLEGLDPSGLDKAIVDEFDTYVDHQIYQAKAGFATLLTSPKAFPSNASVASIYGVPWDGKASSVKTSPTHKGLFNRAAFLYSGRKRGSPILRGVALRTNVLCDPLGTPDASIINSRNDDLAGKPLHLMSTRDVVTTQTSSQVCQACHVSINPLGFALEDFDSFGRFRTVEKVFDENGNLASQHAVDARGTGIRVESGLPEDVDGHDQLVQVLSQSAKAKACLARRIVQSQSGRLTNAKDSCLLADVESVLRNDSSSVYEALLRSVSGEDIFYVGKPQ